MESAVEAQAGKMEQLDGGAKHIVFFDVETNVPGHLCRSFELLEFGAVVLDARGLGEVRSFHTLIRPADLSCVDRRTTNANTITRITVSDAPTFAEVADDIYQVLHGHIWAGHNILKFDILRISEAFSKIGKPAPQPSGVIDTYPLLRRTFGKRAGNYKLATLANYCGYGMQEHRSIADVRMNINVLRSCATMLFLESNYPDIFMAGSEITTSISVSEQSSSFLHNDIEEQEVSSKIRSSIGTGNGSSARRQTGQSGDQTPFRAGNEEELLEEVDSLRKSELISEFKDLKLDPLNNAGVENCGVSERLARFFVHRSCIEDEKRVYPKIVEVNNVLNTDYNPDGLYTAHGVVHVNTNALKEKDVMLEKVQIFRNLLSADEQPSQIEPLLDECTLEEDMPLTATSLTLGKESQDIVTAPTIFSRADFSTMAKPNESGSKKDFEIVPFLLPSSVILSSIELRSSGTSKMLCYNGVPLHLLEFKVRVRFTVNASYAFSDGGKPRFSILIKPSAAACDIIHKCEDLVMSRMPIDDETKWLSGLQNDLGGWAARMSIGTKLIGSCWNYTTEFFRSTCEGLEKMSLDPVDASTFRSFLPHGSIIDVGYGFYFFHFQNQAGVRLLAKHITFS